MRRLLLAGLAAALSLQAQPRVQRFTLPNGLRVLHLEDHERPLVRACLHLSVVPLDTPPGRQGLPQLMLRMLKHAETADLKAEELERILEESGIRLSQTLGRDGLIWRMTARSRDQDRAMGLLADRMLRTLFLPAVLESERQAYWRQEERQEASPSDRLRQALMWDAASRPTRKSLGAITLGDLLTFRAHVFRPERAVLVLHGDLGVEQAKRLVLLSLGAWTAEEVPPVAAAAPTAFPSTDRLTFPVQGMGLQVQAITTEPGDLSPEVSNLLELLIPGNPDLRPVSAAMEGGYFMATLDRELGSTDSGAWALLLERLNSLCQRGFTQADLDRARQTWLGRRRLHSLHPEADMDSALAEALGRGVSEDRMQAVTMEGLNAGLRKWLDPARMRIGAAGDPEALKSLPKP
jgi:predicted Zn-dependent peptidase